MRNNLSWTNQFCRSASSSRWLVTSSFPDENLSFSVIRSEIFTSVSGVQQTDQHVFFVNGERYDKSMPVRSFTGMSEVSDHLVFRDISPDFRLMVESASPLPHLFSFSITVTQGSVRHAASVKRFVSRTRFRKTYLNSGIQVLRQSSILII